MYSLRVSTITTERHFREQKLSTQMLLTHMVLSLRKAALEMLCQELDARICRNSAENSGIAGAGNGAVIALGVPDSGAESPEFWHLQESQFRLPAFWHSGILAYFDMTLSRSRWYR
jgi:hypothetical protein